MKIYLGIPLIIFLSSTISFAQGLYLSGTTGIASYRMGIPKTLFKDLRANSTVPLKTTGNFSPGFYYGTSIGYDLGNHEIGFTAIMNNAAEKLKYSDSNIFVVFDQLFSNRSYGLSITEKFIYNEIGYFYGSIAGFVNLSSGSIISDIRLGQNKEYIRHDLTSFGYSGSLSAGFAFVRDKLSIKPEIGYLLNFFNNSLMTNEYPQYKLVYKNEDVKVDWTGLRFGITLSYHLNGHKAFEKKEELKPTDWSF